MTRFYLLIFFCLSVAFASGQERDTPQKGEGIHAFLRRHNRMDEKQYEEFIRLNKAKLGKSNTLLKGTVYLLPPLTATTNPTTATTNPTKGPEPGNAKVRTGVQPLFGEKYKNYEIKDDLLAGACFYLVSGHGGPDPGAIAKVNGNELHEDEYAYDITLRLARCLLEHNATVHIIIQDPHDGIRDDKYLNNSKDETCMGKEIPQSKLLRLKQESNEINRISFKSKAKYQRAIYIHLNSVSNKKQMDIFFYYQKNNAQSLRLAETMRKTFRTFYTKNRPGRGFSGTVSTRPLYVMRNTTPVSIYAELANMQNTSDQQRYVPVSGRQDFANWFCAGFIKDYQSSPH